MSVEFINFTIGLKPIFNWGDVRPRGERIAMRQERDYKAILELYNKIASTLPPGKIIRSVEP